MQAAAAQAAAVRRRRRAPDGHSWARLADLHDRGVSATMSSPRRSQDPGKLGGREQRAVEMLAQALELATGERAKRRADLGADRDAANAECRLDGGLERVAGERVP